MSIRWVRWTLPVIVLGAGVGGALWMNSTPDSASAAPDSQSVESPSLADAPTVATAVVEAGRWSPELLLYPRYQSQQTVVLTSTVTAEVTSVEVTTGQAVAEGAVLMQLDTDALQRQVTQLEARRTELVARTRLEQRQYQSDQAALSIEQNLVDISRRSVERLQNLARQNLSSSADLEAAERILQNQRLALQQRELALVRYQDIGQQLAAQLDDLDSQLAQARDTLARATVTAPFPGRVVAIERKPGALVMNGTALLTLVNEQQTEWVAWASASALSGVDLSVPLAGRVETDSGLQPVTLVQRDPVADRGSVRLYFQAQGRSRSATLNRTYRLWLQLPAIEAHRVPDASVYANESVYRVVDNRLQRVPVTLLGEQFDEGQLWRLIEADFTASDAVLTTRLQQAADGLAVKVAAQ